MRRKPRIQAEPASGKEAASGANRTLKQLLAAVSVLIGATWILGAWILRGSSPAPSAPVTGPTQRSAPQPSPPKSPWNEMASGPWGTLESQEIVLELPSGSVSPASCSVQPEPWVFPGHTRAQVQGLFETAFLGDDQRERLLQSIDCDAGGCRILPPVDVSRSLRPEARRTLYSLLGRFPENPSVLYGFRRKASRLDAWFDAAGLLSSTRTTVRALMWNAGDSAVLSDVASLCASITSDEEKVRVVKALSRTRSLLVRLRVTPGSDVPALVRYWTRGVRKKDVRPMLESLARLPDGATIDIVHLLPTFGRIRLNTFPHPDDPPLDSNWTSLNFLGEEPQDRFMNIAEAWRELQMSYFPVPTESAALGDVIAFLDRDSSLKHTAAFVGARVVFTKNGRSYRKPWSLMSLDELNDLYSFNESGTIQVFRPR